MTIEQTDMKENIINLIDQNLRNVEFSKEDTLKVIDTWYWLLDVYKDNNADVNVLLEVTEYLNDIFENLNTR